MSHGPVAPAAAFRTRRIFVISSLALFTAGLSFSLRMGIISTVESEILVAVDPARAGELSGILLGTAFSGFAFTLLLGSILLDRIGMGRMLAISGSCFIVGTALSIGAPSLASGEHAYPLLRAGFLLSGLGWGFMEASVNPLTAALYPDDKTHRLNVLHAWWPAGLMVGGLSVLGLDALGIGWRGQL
jgi:MFS family permease